MTTLESMMSEESLHTLVCEEEMMIDGIQTYCVIDKGHSGQCIFEDVELIRTWVSKE